MIGKLQLNFTNYVGLGRFSGHGWCIESETAGAGLGRVWDSAHICWAPTRCAGLNPNGNALHAGPSSRSPASQCALLRATLSLIFHLWLAALLPIFRFALDGGWPGLDGFGMTNGKPRCHRCGRAFSPRRDSHPWFGNGSYGFDACGYCHPPLLFYGLRAVPARWCLPPLVFLRR